MSAVRNEGSTRESRSTLQPPRATKHHHLEETHLLAHRKLRTTGFLVACLLAVAGCQDVPDQATIAPSVAVVKPVVATVELNADELSSIAELDKADQPVAKTQKTCIISRENHLGSMGLPIKVTFEGKVGFLCCGGCKEAFDKDPAAAFAKAGL